MKSFFKKGGSGPRYFLLDEIRGFCILCMVFFHGFYLMWSIFEFNAGEVLFNFFAPIQPVFAGAFILISGICCRFSRSNLRRGAVLLAVALGLTAVTFGLRQFGIDEIIRFGILHFMAVAILIFALLRPALNKIPVWVQLILFIGLFILFWNVQNGFLGVGRLSLQLPTIVKDSVFLYPLGLHSVTFFSADYFPIFPWLFLFLAGSALGVYGQAGKFPRFVSGSHVCALQFVGRNSLVVYLFHQPVIYLILLAIKR